MLRCCCWCYAVVVVVLIAILLLFVAILSLYLFLGIGGNLSKYEPLAVFVGQCRCLLVFAWDRILLRYVCCHSVVIVLAFFS